MRTTRQIDVTWGDTDSKSHGGQKGIAMVKRGVLLVLLGAVTLSVLGAAYFATGAGEGYPEPVAQSIK